MKRKILVLMVSMIFATSLLAGCGCQKEAVPSLEEAQKKHEEAKKKTEEAQKNYDKAVSDYDKAVSDYNEANDALKK